MFGVASRRCFDAGLHFGPDGFGQPDGSLEFHWTWRRTAMIWIHDGSLDAAFLKQTVMLGSPVRSFFLKTTFSSSRSNSSRLRAKG